jgi:PAS domain S-box-containing protein
MSSDVRELLELALPSMRDYALILTDAQGVIVGWLAGSEHVLGYTPSEIVGKPLSTIFVAEDAEKGVPEFEVEVARLRGTAQDDRWHLRKDGSRIWVSGTLTAISDASGIRGYMKVIRDRTDSRMATEATSNRLAAVESALSTTREFLRTLGHELRNPLGAIKNVAWILGRSDDKQLKGFSGIIANQLAILERLASDLMDVSRLEQQKTSLKLEDIDLAALVRDEVGARQYEARDKGIDLEAILPLHPVVVRGDRDRLRQALGNLLANSLKYTLHGGTVWVKAMEEADDVLIRVQDTGIGIAPDVLPQIFELFTQEPRAREVAPGGLGIGLSVVREIVRIHGGSVQARSGGVDKGSEFTIRIPRRQAIRPDTP